MTATADLIASIRGDVGDSAGDNALRWDNPETIGPVDGVQTFFGLQNKNIVSGTPYVSTNFATPVNTGFTVSVADGTITFTAPPASGSNVRVVYQYYHYADAYYTRWVTEATRMLGFTYADPTPVPDGLLPALVKA